MSPVAASPAVESAPLAAPETDGLLPEHAHPIRLPVFEGPLDLLLYLIRKNEIDIHDIPIGVVTRQYLEVLRSYEKMNLDVAGEFFVMAATLMVIKSRMLLPPEKAAAPGSDEAAEPDEDDDANLDPRWQLVRQLIQYKRIKESAGHLYGLIEARQGFAPRLVPPPQEQESDRPVADSDKIELWTTFNTILRRLSERVLPGEIRADPVTISTRMEDILARLRSEKTFSFSSLIPARPTVALLVATFLACLELARLGKVVLEQTVTFDDIVLVERPADDPLDLFSEAPRLPPDAATPEAEDEPPAAEAADFDDEDFDEDDLEEDDFDDDPESIPDASPSGPPDDETPRN